MADPASIILIGSEILAVGEIGLRNYLTHRKKMIEDGREDELVSSRVKKFAQSMSRDCSPLVRYGEVYEEEKSDPDEIPAELPARPSAIKRFSEMSKRKSINGFNHAVEFLRKSHSHMTRSRDSTPARQHVPEPVPEPVHEPIPEPVAEPVPEPAHEQKRRAFFFMRLKG